MKKVPLMIAVLLVLALAFTASADARCGVGCLNHKVKKLTTSLKQAEQAINAQTQTIEQQSQAITALNTAQIQTAKQVKSLFGCLVEAPLTQYGEPDGPLGYSVKFENEDEEIKDGVTTALDVTYTGDGVGGWALFDSCNTAESLSVASRNALAPAADLRSLFPQSQR